MCQITEHNICIEWCDAIVWASIKSEQLAIPVKMSGVKFKETNGDKKKALELAIERLLQ